MPAIINGSTGYTFPDGTVQTTAATAAFSSGTRMSFQQTAAPTGWTKDTTAAINDSILRLVTGSVSSGGSVGWSSASVGATTLSTAQIPSHTHDTIVRTDVISPAGNARLQGSNASGATGTYTTAAAGGGGSHTHGLAGDCKYYDFIIASKD